MSSADANNQELILKELPNLLRDVKRLPGGVDVLACWLDRTSPKVAVPSNRLEEMKFALEAHDNVRDEAERRLAFKRLLTAVRDVIDTSKPMLAPTRVAEVRKQAGNAEFDFNVLGWADGWSLHRAVTELPRGTGLYVIEER